MVDMLKVSLCGIILWNLLWCIGLINVEVFFEINDVYMPHNGPRAEERDDYEERFEGYGAKFQMILYHGEYTREEMWEHSNDVKNLITSLELTWDGKTHKYDTPDASPFWSQTDGQPLRYSKLDCFQEGSLDYHTVTNKDMLDAAKLVQNTVGLLDTTPSQLTGPWLNPYNWCIWMDLFKLMTPALGEQVNTFGACKGFLNPKPEETFEVIQRAYDWMNFFLFDAADGDFACKVHGDFADENNPMYSRMVAEYTDSPQCQGLYAVWNGMDVAVRNNLINQGLASQNVDPPAFWKLNDRVLTDEQVAERINADGDEGCYMWDNGVALPQIPGFITNRDDGLLALYFTKAKEDFCKDLEKDKEWDCYNKLFDWGDEWGNKITVHNSNGFADYQTEADAVESYQEAIWIVIGGLAAIIVYVLIVGFCHKTPLLMGAGVFLLFLGMIASVGLGSAMGVGLTPPMLTVFPLLTMGIGVDDMFILTCDPKNAWHSIPSITTTSTINILVGCLGFTNPIPYVANFSLYFGIGSFMLYLTNIFGVYSLCTIYFGPEDSNNEKAKTTDIEMTDNSPKEDKTESDVKDVIEDTPKFRPIGRWVVVLSSVLLTAMLIAFPFQKIEQDMGMNMLYKKDSTKWDFFVEFRKAGELHTTTLVTKETDFAHHQTDWPQFIRNIQDTTYSADIGVTWMDIFKQWGIPDQTQNSRCSESDYFGKGYCGPKLTPDVGVPVLTNTEVVPPYVGMSSCIILPAMAWICDGVPGSCNFGDADVLADDLFNGMMYHPDKFDLCANKWVDFDNVWISAQAAFQCDDNGKHVSCDSLPSHQGLRKLKGGRVDASKTALYLKDVEVVIRDWIRYIQDVREVRENSPFDTYLYSSYHNAFSSFEGIWDKVYTSFGACMAVVFVVITVSITVQTQEKCGDGTIMQAVITAFITCAFMAMAWFCTVSMLSVFDLPMMPPTMVIILLTLGIAVEVMGHIGQEFVRTRGSRSLKARTALSNLWWPLGNGLVTTILAVSIFFAAQWYFLADMIGSIILVSLFVTLYMGLLVFPAALSLFGPPFCTENGPAETTTSATASI